jgi:hypothetical protein
MRPVVVSHPIQYYAPLFREVAKRLDVTVFSVNDAAGRGRAALSSASGGRTPAFETRRETRCA